MWVYSNAQSGDLEWSKGQERVTVFSTNYPMRWWTKCVSMVIAKTASRNIAATDPLNKLPTQQQIRFVTKTNPFNNQFNRSVSTTNGGLFLELFLKLLLSRVVSEQVLFLNGYSF